MTRSRSRKRFTIGDFIRRYYGTVGIRGDYVHMQDSMFTDEFDRQSRWRLSADLTWYPTEFSRIRLQYNQDFVEENFFLSGREVESVFLQWEFILGSHGAHKF